MDPVSALVLAMLIAGYFTRNTVQDLAWKARGEDPPSYRRQMARIERKENRRPVTERQEARRFFANAWADAWESAHERRSRAAAKKTEQRREKWDARDAADEAWPEADEANREHDRRTAAEQLAQCGVCGRDVRRAELACVAVAGKPVDACPACADSARAAYPKPRDGAGPQPAPHADTQTPGARQPAVDPAPSRPQTPDTPGDAGGTLIPFTPRRDSATNPDKAVTEPIGAHMEAHNLASAITYTGNLADAVETAGGAAEQNEASSRGMAEAAQQNAANVEQAAAGLRGGGVSGPAVQAMASAHEQLSAAAAAFRQAEQATTQGREHLAAASQAAQAANGELRRHLRVRESYEANKGAGSREYVTQD